MRAGVGVARRDLAASRLAGATLLVLAQRIQLAQEVRDRDGRSRLSTDPLRPGEAHGRGPGLDLLAGLGQEPRIGQGDAIVAAHVGAERAVEEEPGPVGGQGQVRDPVIGQVAARPVGLPDRAGREERLGQVGPPQPQQQAELDRYRLIDGDRGALRDGPVSGPESAECTAPGPCSRDFARAALSESTRARRSASRSALSPIVTTG